MGHHLGDIVVEMLMSYFASLTRMCTVDPLDARCGLCFLLNGSPRIVSVWLLILQPWLQAEGLGNAPKRPLVLLGTVGATTEDSPISAMCQSSLPAGRISILASRAQYLAKQIGLALPTY